MLYLLTSHTSGRLASPLKQFVRYVLPNGGYRIVNRLPDDITKLDVAFGFTNPATNGLRKLKLDRDTILEAAKFNLRQRLKAPGPIEDLRGTFWRSGRAPHVMCCSTWHPKAGLYAYRTLTARWMLIAHEMSLKTSPEEQDGMLHQWRAEVEPPLDRLYRSKGLVAVDTENDWNGEKATKLTMVSIGDEFGSAVWRWTPKVAAVFADWLQSPAEKVMQNWVHDVPWLERSCKVKVHGPLFDTMALAAEFCRQWPKGLQHLAAQQLIVEPWKTLHTEGTLAEITYAAYDAESTYLLAMEYFKLMPSLRDAAIQGIAWP